jgi:UDP-N-acetylglucosamine transferase subunit ALG13
MDVFVAVGTSHFDSLVERMDEIAPRLQGRVVMQIGIGSSTPKNVEFFRFAPSLAGHMAAASVVVSHGGFGIMTEALGMGKRVVGVENKDMYDNHQVELLRKFSEEGYITWCRDLRTLEESIHEASRSNPRPYTRPESSIGRRIREFLGAPVSAVPEPEERR